jgi:hypothetical protein
LALELLSHEAMPVATNHHFSTESVPPVDDAAPAPQPLNWAVVSFLLEDAVWCDWLYREFDGQRIPRTLLGRPSRFGTPYPDRIAVYPDPADPDQLENYAETLQTGQHLVVVISPASGQSPVIEDHLKSFRASGGEERVIVLVVKGEPASPSAEPGTQADEAWLPKWLSWRFHGNQFDVADSMEPLVIDARLGVASLSEVRARLMAALLEIDRARLSEYGAFKRSSTNLHDLPSASLISALQAPSTISFNSIATEEAPATRHSRWPVWATAISAFIALGCLAYWPDRNARPVTQSTPQFRPLPTQIYAPTEPIIPPGESLVEAQPVGTPLSEPAPVAKTPPPVATPQASPAIAEPLTPAQPTAAELTAQKRQELLASRERLVALGESRLANGELEEALEIFEESLAIFQQLAELSNQAPNDLLDLCAMYRRLGALADRQRSAAEARSHFEAARRTLVQWRAKAALPQEATRLLADVETNLRQLRKP